jgi:plexin A
MALLKLLQFYHFRCKEMADNCGMCLSLDEKFECGWCQSSGKCEVKDKCGKDATSWLNRDQTCPNPQVRIFQFTVGLVGQDHLYV